VKRSHLGKNYAVEQENDADDLAAEAGDVADLEKPIRLLD